MIMSLLIFIRKQLVFQLLGGNCMGLKSALALWNFASGEPAEGRIPQGESVANFTFFRTFVFS